MSRYKTEIEKSLVRIEFVLEQLQPKAALSAEALQGIEKQLKAALPRHKRNKLLPGHRSTTSAINRLINMCMALFNGEPGIGEFDKLRKAVIAAARGERQRWDVLAETHAWLSEGREKEDVLSQLEDRFVENGIEIIWEFDGFTDNRFLFEGEGEEAEVIKPAYLIKKESETSMTIKPGIVSLSRKPQSLLPWPKEPSEKLEAKEVRLNDPLLVSFLRKVQSLFSFQNEPIKELEAKELRLEDPLDDEDTDSLIDNEENKLIDQENPIERKENQ